MAQTGAADVSSRDGKMVALPNEEADRANWRQSSQHRGAACPLAAPMTVCFHFGEGCLPLIATQEGRVNEKNRETVRDLLHQSEGNAPPVHFVLGPRLAVDVCRRNLTCCGVGVVWCFVTRGLRHLGQEELCFLLKCDDDEEEDSLPPMDLFVHIGLLAERVARGLWIQEFDHSCFVQDNFLAASTEEHVGFLFLRPSFQCIKGLPLPQPSSLVGVLIQRGEAHWAECFPLRLALRLGAAFRMYPAPLISARRRPPVYGETETASLLALLNIHSRIPGLSVLLSKGRTEVRIPQEAAELVQRSVATMDGQVLALGAEFCPLADSHLVCVQDEHGRYGTHAINMAQRGSQLTGASFVVFNGNQEAFRTALVEDGLVVQLSSEQMAALLQALGTMQPLTLNCDDNVLELDWTTESLPYAHLEPTLFSMEGRQEFVETLRPCYLSDASVDALVRLCAVRLVRSAPFLKPHPFSLMELMIDDLASAALGALEPMAADLLELGFGQVTIQVNLGPAEVCVHVKFENRFDIAR